MAAFCRFSVRAARKKSPALCALPDDSASTILLFRATWCSTYPGILRWINGKSPFKMSKPISAEAKYSGRVKADLRESPVYGVSANFSGLNLAALAAGSPTLAHQFSGNATGEIELEMHGVGRDALVASLACRGRAAIQPASLLGFDLFDSLHAGARRAGSSAFSEVSGTFACRDDQIELSGVRLRSGGYILGASGTVDFAPQCRYSPAVDAASEKSGARRRRCPGRSGIRICFAGRFLRRVSSVWKQPRASKSESHYTPACQFRKSVREKPANMPTKLRHHPLTTFKRGRSSPR